MKIPKLTAKFVLVSLLTFALTFVLGVWLTRMGTTRTSCPRLSMWQVLLSFENQNLQGLDTEPRRQVEAAVQGHLGKLYDYTLDPYQAAIFRSMLNTKGEKRYVLIEKAPLVHIPGNSSLRAYIFDTAGGLLNVQEFSAGNRRSLTGMRIRKNGLINDEALIVDTEYCIGGGHPSSQYYALIGERMELIYLEQDGQLDRNDYQSSNLTIGPKIVRSVDEWEKVLSSSNDAEVLSALVWLGGVHWTDIPSPYDDKVEAEKAHALRSRAGVRKRLRELSQFENPWIASAAKSAHSGSHGQSLYNRG
jgi:hypothetical protein